MAIRVFDFVCNRGHSSELFADEAVKQLMCPLCGEVAHRVISIPRFKLDGVSGDFPTAGDKWARVHTEAAAVANAKHMRHNE